MVVVEMEEGGEVRECSLKGRDLLVGKKTGALSNSARLDPTA